MADATDIDRDIAIFKGMIDGPDAALAPFLAEHPDLTTAQAARDDLAILVARLEEVRDGRVVPHAEIVKDMEARRAAHRVQAAE